MVVICHQFTIRWFAGLAGGFSRRESNRSPSRYARSAMDVAGRGASRFRSLKGHHFGKESNFDANLGGGFKDCFFHPYLGKWSNLTHMFQTGWNHQLEIYGHFEGFTSRKGVLLNNTPQKIVNVHKISLSLQWRIVFFGVSYNDPLYLEVSFVNCGDILNKGPPWKCENVFQMLERSTILGTVWEFVEESSGNVSPFWIWWVFFWQRCFNWKWSFLSWPQTEEVLIGYW